MIALSLALAAALAAAPAPSGAGEGPRAALLVGAVAPVPGRAVLRHAYRDAETLADVLATVGGFPRDRIHVLRDPDPAALLAAVQREAASLAGAPHAMLFFYYSGHAGDGALFTGGKRLDVDVLRRALDRPDVSVRVGVIDACEGGGWTRAKGLVPDAPFDVRLPPLVESEGSALIASSSGTESAHESDALGGSYFTHHFAAALRGAADVRRHGEVTLTEAFEYARAQTIRETARHAAEPQHPSFAVNLKGRQDIVLAQVATSPSTLALDQQEGPLEVVHLRSGLRILQLPPGTMSVVVAVPAGEYLVRELRPDGVRAREITVPAAGAAYVQEHDLVLVGSERLALKGADAPRASTAPPSSPERLHGELELGFETTDALGREYVGFGTGNDVGFGGMLRFDGRLALTDRLLWKIGTAALAYRLGDRGGIEVIPYAGLLAWKLPYLGQEGVPAIGGFYRGAREYRIGGGVGTKIPFRGGALVFTLGAERDHIGEQAGTRYLGGIGITVAPMSKLTLHVAVGQHRYEFPTLLYDRYDPATGYRQIGGYGGQATSSWIGSSQDLGLAAIPLVSVGPFRGYAFDLYGGGEEYRRVWWRLGVAKQF